MQVSQCSEQNMQLQMPKGERSQITQISSLRNQKKENKSNPKQIERKGMKIRVEIKKVENRKTTERKINETKVGPFENINKITKSFIKMTKEKKKFRITKIRNERGGITTDLTEIKKHHRGHYKQLYAKEIDSLDEMDKALVWHKLPKPTQEEIDNLNGPIASKEIKLN